MLNKDVMNKAKEACVKYTPKTLSLKKIYATHMNTKIQMEVYKLAVRGFSDEEIKQAIKPELQELHKLIDEIEKEES